jgi:hypothetical protein
MQWIDGRTLSHETSEHIRRMAVRRVEQGERPSSVIASYGLCRTTIYLGDHFKTGQRWSGENRPTERLGTSVI